jgi:MFS family permease
MARRTTHHRALAVGLIMAITLNAFEAVAVVTAMPAISSDLHGDALYGATFSAYMLASLVALVVGGEQADRRGPAAPFIVGVVLFGAGLVVAGAAPTMAVVLVGRVLQGAGSGSLGTTAYVAIGRTWSAEEQPRLFAMLASAWVVPSLFAPLAAGWITEQWSWRWVFFGLLPLVPLLVVLALRPLRRLGPPDQPNPDPGRLPLALRLATGSALVVGGLQLAAPVPALVLVLAGVALAVPALRRLLPPGTFRALPGIPAAVAARLCVNVAFFGTDTYVPFAAVRIHGSSTLVAGLVIIGASLSWTMGAQIAARRGAGADATAKVRAGFVILAIGIAGTSAVVLAAVPLGVTFFTWAIGGFGIGVVFNTTSSTAIAQAPAGQEGLVGSQLGIADTLGFAFVGAVGGALIGVADRTSLSLGAALAMVFGLSVAAAITGARVASRVRVVTPD